MASRKSASRSRTEQERLVERLTARRPKRADRSRSGGERRHLRRLVALQVAGLDAQSQQRLRARATAPRVRARAGAKRRPQSRSKSSPRSGATAPGGVQPERQWCRGHPQERRQQGRRTGRCRRRGSGGDRRRPCAQEPRPTQEGPRCADSALDQEGRPARPRREVDGQDRGQGEQAVRPRPRRTCPRTSSESVTRPSGSERSSVRSRRPAVEGESGHGSDEDEIHAVGQRKRTPGALARPRRRAARSRRQRVGRKDPCSRSGPPPRAWRAGSPWARG